MERYVPDGKHDYINIEHKQRYHFAMSYVKGKNVLDAACGEGYGSSMMSKDAANVVGIDISEEAIFNANEKYGSSNLSYKVGDVKKLDFDDNFFDVVVSFETIEHVPEVVQWSFIKEIRRVLKDDGVLIMSTPNKKVTDQRQVINEYHVKEFYKYEFVELLEEQFEYIDLYSQYYGDGLFLHKCDYKKIPMHLNRTQNELVKDDFYIAVASQEKIAILGDAPIFVSDRDFHHEIVTLYNAYKQKESELSLLQESLTSTTNELTKLREITAQVEVMQNELKNLLSLIQHEKDTAYNAIDSVRSITNGLMRTRLFKIIHLWARFKYQLLLGSFSEKRNFFRWFFSRTKRVPQRGKSYHPLARILDATTLSTLGKSSLPDDTSLSYTKNDELKRGILAQDYKKFDVIILAIIDYDFRHQRPQHFANIFAKNGHRVFYFNANHHRDCSVKLQHENLYVIDIFNPTATAIHLTDWSNKTDELHSAFNSVLNQYALRDAVVMVNYPNWIYGAEYLRQKFGFKLIADYMDDFMGFINPASKLVRQNCTRLLDNSDCVIASSQFLYDIAIKHNKNVEIIRNGTDNKFFSQAYLPHSEPSKNKRKVIGYYGAISHWFAHDIVCYVAKNLPDCDLVLIGEVTAYEKELSRIPNIKLLGEKPYNTLPGYLTDFDVCLIPFDTSTDLIKATNPVKFYEYLSAGKKIVSTEIPELEPYKNKYVLMSNDKTVFLEHVKSCLGSTDALMPPEELMELARKNNWGTRFNSLVKLIKNSVPKVSVVVLTFNNLKLNKICIRSILEKTAYPNFELIIVDNNSTDGTVDYLNELNECRLSNVKVILNKENLGFAAGNNVGIKASDGDYVILLNNDTIVTRGWITALVKHLENDSEMGMSGAVTNSIGNEAKIRTQYTKIDEMYGFADSYTWAHMGEIFHKQPNALAMFAICIKRDVIDKCGYIDESYAIGMFEDDDYSRAVINAGYKLCIAEDSFIHHFDGSTFKKMDDEKYRKLFTKNMEIYNKKWNTKWQGHEYRDGVGVDCAVIEIQEV